MFAVVQIYILQDTLVKVTYRTCNSELKLVYAFGK